LAFTRGKGPKKVEKAERKVQEKGAENTQKPRKKIVKTMYFSANYVHSNVEHFALGIATMPCPRSTMYSNGPQTSRMDNLNTWNTRERWCGVIGVRAGRCCSRENDRALTNGKPSAIMSTPYSITTHLKTDIAFIIL
jgi:hypothetical protein